MLNLIANLLFEYLDKFQAYSTNFRHIILQSATEFNPIFLEMKLVSLYNLNVFFMTNLICLLLSFRFNFIYSSSTFLLRETASKMRTGRINLINTWLALLHKQHISKIKHNSPDSIQKYVDELIC